MGFKRSVKLEEKDRIIFDLKIKKEGDSNDNIIKLENKTITLGNNEITNGVDENIIGLEISKEDHIFELKMIFSEKTFIFDELEFEANTYNFSFKVKSIEKFNSREKIDFISKRDAKEEKSEKNKIRQLEETNQMLNEKIKKLEEEKILSEKIFKAKVDEISKNATVKVEELKEEIKNKAKEEINHKTRFAIQKLLDDILGPLNNLFVAVKAGSASTDPNVAGYVKGFEMLTTQIFGTLESHGLKVIEPKLGERFNPELHQVHEVVEDSTKEKDTIVKIVSRGYKLHERVIKPSIVNVIK